jgi:hypothetical protein
MESGKLQEKLILMYLPYALARVDKAIDLTLPELREYKKQSPEFFDYVKRYSLDEHVAFLVSHSKDGYYGQYVERMLTPEGREWLSRNYELMRQIAGE